MTDVADVYPHWQGVTQPCDVCGRLVAVNAVSPSECFCSAACAYRAAGLDDEEINTSDIPEAGPDFFARAQRKDPL